MTDETLAAIKEGVDIKMYEMGYGLLEMSDIIRNLHREYMELD
jgi:oligoribonuclease (3'-5' exoribonuclease)